MRTGSYYYYYGIIDGRTTDGAWWSTASYSATNSRFLGVYRTNIKPQNLIFRGNGYAIRCTIRVE